MLDAHPAFASCSHPLMPRSRSRPLPELLLHARDLLAPLGEIRTKSMFGSWGLYCDDLFFGIFADDMLYLKVDAETQALFRDAGGHPFCYGKRDGSTQALNFWTPPEEAMESIAGMRPWAKQALAAAIRARKPGKDRP